MVDFALTLPAVDPKRIALMGVSLGGVLAPRSAAFEKRLAALIANDGVYDYGAAQLASAPPDQRADAVRMIRADHAPEMDAALDALMKSSPTARWAFTHGMYATGTSTPRSYLAASLAFNVRDGVAEAIACPTLVCDAEGDLFFKGQPQELYDHLTWPENDDRIYRGGGGWRSLSGWRRDLRAKIRECHADEPDALRRRENRPDQVEGDLMQFVPGCDCCFHRSATGGNLEVSPFDFHGDGSAPDAISSGQSFVKPVVNASESQAAGSNLRPLLLRKNQVIVQHYLFFDRSALHRKDLSTRSQSRIEGRREIVASDIGDRTMKKTLLGVFSSVRFTHAYSLSAIEEMRLRTSAAQHAMRTSSRRPPLDAWLELILFPRSS